MVFLTAGMKLTKRLAYSRILSLINRMRDEARPLGADSQTSLRILQELGGQLCSLTLVL